MNDEMIIALFFDRNEDAIRETEKKYGSLCKYIASNILAMREDVEECINDVMLKLWNNIPPERPDSLRAYIATSVRNDALNKSRDSNAWKRGGQVQTVGDEFLSLIEDGSDLAAEYEAHRAGEIINEFLSDINKSDKRIFIMRYWMELTVPQISKQTGYGESKIKMTLSRLRAALKKKLEKEGIIV